MQVHEPTALVLGDLHVSDAHLLAQPRLGLVREPARACAAGRPTCAARARGACCSTRTAALVVEAVGAQRLAQARIVVRVDLAAGERDAVLADRRVAPRPAPPRLPILAERRLWTARSSAR